ncbi:hypothetical protein JCM6882_003438 [Rhodosporidiobolus microsporus]
MPPRIVYQNHTIELVAAPTSSTFDVDDSLAALRLDDSNAPTSTGRGGNAAGLPALPVQEAVKEDSTPWMSGGRERTGEDGRELTPMELLDDEIVSFVKWSRPTVDEHNFRKQVFSLFERIVQRLWPGAEVELFGSMVTGLYLPHGDFDVVVHHDALHRLPTPQILRSLANALRTSSFALSSSIELVSTAKVPIAKFRTTSAYGSYRFDVSFNGPKGPAGAQESMRLLAELEQREPGAKERARRLIVLLKALLDSLRLNEVKHGGLGGLSTFCLGVSFVQLLRRQSQAISPGEDLLRFLHAFEFDYQNDSITVANGGGLLNKRQKGWSLARDPGRLSIQHPVDLSRDLSSGSHEWRKTILPALADTFDYVNEFLDRAVDPDFPSSAIRMTGISFSPQVLAQRRENQRLAAEGALDEMVRSWVPQVREDPAVARMRMNGFVSVPPTPSPSTYTPSPSPLPMTAGAQNGAAFSPATERYLSLAPPPQQPSLPPQPSPQPVYVSHSGPSPATVRSPFLPEWMAASQAARGVGMLPVGAVAAAPPTAAYAYPQQQPQQQQQAYTAVPAASSFRSTYLPHLSSFFAAPRPAPSSSPYTGHVLPNPTSYTAHPAASSSHASSGPPPSFSSPPPAARARVQPLPPPQLYGRTWEVAPGVQGAAARWGAPPPRGW